MAMAPKLIPTPPSYPPPPSCIKSDEDPLYKAYLLLHSLESEKDEEDRLGGEEYNQALRECIAKVKERNPKFIIVNGEVYQEMEVEVEYDDEDDGEEEYEEIEVEEYEEIEVEVENSEAYEEVECKDDGEEEQMQLDWESS